MEQKSTIKAVGFDLFGTMAAFSIYDQLAYLVKHLGVSSDELGAAVLSKLKYAPSGTLVSDVWPHISKELGKNIPDELVEGWQNEFFEILIRPELVALIKRLQRNGYKVGLLTNLEQGTVLPPPFERVFKLFDVALRSDRLNYAKPQLEAYQAFAKELNVSPDELVFIDDLPGNIQGAKSAGLNGIQFHDTEQLLNDLEQLGVNKS